ncbi:MAG: hypothetical protein E5Y06_22025 [Mesorhizobium sp.]|nr:MAG: hypothetical protein E5Y06_22025 [Mesorhizobium sp.]TJU97277.1 MAG: hypothetical protein E5Y08_17210 [Mesorhizobium sp.]TJV16603.1 MAG: hypothetical protein E5Y07_17495 [Mesorhizobium sp.]
MDGEQDGRYSFSWQGWLPDCGKSRDSAPLCPAGHLPHEGGDWQHCRQRLFYKADSWRKRRKWPISPLVGEMSGRTEGGATERDLHPSSAQPSPPTSSRSAFPPCRDCPCL